MQLWKHTWKLVLLPDGKKPVKSKWFFLNKTNEHRNFGRKRARLVGKGFSQKLILDFEAVFYPVSKYSTMQLILAFATQQYLDPSQLDVKSAFLNGEIQEEIHLEEPA